MKTTRKISKLQLSRETLLGLDRPQLELAFGGVSHLCTTVKPCFSDVCSQIHTNCC
jgi:hypothetical protein